MDFSLIHKLILVFLVQFATCEKILLVMILQGSHITELSTIGQGLIERGHQVYGILPINNKAESVLQKKGITVIHCRPRGTFFATNSDEFNKQISKWIFTDKPTTIEDGTVDFMLDSVSSWCEAMLEDKEMLNEIKALKIDIALVDAFPLNYCSYLIPDVLELKTVGASSSLSFWDMGIPALPSFVPSSAQLQNDKMSFYERIKSAVYHAILTTNMFPGSQDMNIMLKYAPNIKYRTDLLRRSQFLIVYRDYLMQWPVPSMPNTLFLQLPDSIKSIYTKAIKGVIIVSFGSSADYLPFETFQKFISVQ